VDRIKTILLINKGFTYKQIEEILLIDEKTINRYKNLYKNEGIDGLAANNYRGGGGGRYKLSDERIDIIKKELNEKIYMNSRMVCDFIRKRFQIKYTPQGMVQTLRRLGFSYKKAAAVPGKLNGEEQKKFVRRYAGRFLRRKEGEKVYFMDGCHPTFCNRIGYGWIERGKVFLVELRRRNRDEKIYVICDNVPSKYSIAMVIGYLKGKSAIRVHREILGIKKNFTNKNFWTRGYCVSTVGLNEQQVREYIRSQEKLDTGEQGQRHLNGAEIL
jgi:transposase